MTDKTDLSTTIVHSAGGKGGVGKTVIMMAIADYLRSKRFKTVAVDCDTENTGSPSCFGHWFDGKHVEINLRVPADRDRLLTDAAQSGADYVLADFPSNATGDVSKWLRDVATAKTIRDMRLRMVTLCVVTPEAGSVKSAVKWITTMGDRASYLVALNRIDYETVETPTQVLFADWFTAVAELVPSVIPAERIKTFEVPNLEEIGMVALTKLGKVPSKALESNGLNLLNQSRVRSWRDAIFAELDKSGFFPAAKVAAKEPALAAAK